MNLRGMLSNVRVRTRNPRAQQPSDRTLLLLLSTAVQNLLIEANLRGRYWAVDETEVTVNPNTTEYQIATEGFGKPVEVFATYPSGGQPGHTVEFYELGDMSFEVDGGEWASWFSGDRPPYTHQRVAFYRKQGNIYLRTLQGGQAGASYKILFQIGQFGQTVPLDEEIMLPEFYALVELRTAIAALPHCEWHDDESRNEALRKQLALTLDRDEQRTYQLFKSFVATQSANVEPNYRELYPID